MAVSLDLLLKPVKPNACVKRIKAEGRILDGLAIVARVLSAIVMRVLDQMVSSTSLTRSQAILIFDNDRAQLGEGLRYRHRVA